MEKIKRSEPVSSVSSVSTQSVPIGRERLSERALSYQTTSWLARAKQYLADLGNQYDSLTVRIGKYSNKDVSDLYYSARNGSVYLSVRIFCTQWEKAKPPLSAAFKF